MNKFFILLILIFSWLTANAGATTKIVVLGDSISASYGINIDQGWINLLQNKINAANLGYSIQNESISGDTSAGGLARIDQVLARHQPKLLLLELGANDGMRGMSPKLMKSNLAEIVKRSKTAGAKVLLLSMRIPTNYGKRYTDMFYNSYLDLGKELDIPVVPFILEDVALKKELMQKDRIHPNAKAQVLIAEHVWPYLLPMLKP
jgi:acyl-CoA thioesterase-1